MVRKNKGNIKPTQSRTSSKPKETGPVTDYSDLKIVLDLCFPTLYVCTQFNDFSNYYSTASKYIEFSTYLNTEIYQRLNRTTLKEFLGNKEDFTKHTHLAGSKDLDRIRNIVKSAFLRQGILDEGDRYIQQNILDAHIWQIGIKKSLGRIYGYFNKNVFTPILLDPNHLVNKTEKGHERRHTDINTLKFDPRSLNEFKYEEECLRCNGSKRSKLIPYKKDIGLKQQVYICESCYLEMIENNQET